MWCSVLFLGVPCLLTHDCDRCWSWSDAWAKHVFVDLTSLPNLFALLSPQLTIWHVMRLQIFSTNTICCIIHLMSSSIKLRATSRRRIRLLMAFGNSDFECLVFDQSFDTYCFTSISDQSFLYCMGVTLGLGFLGHRVECRHSEGLTLEWGQVMQVNKTHGLHSSPWAIAQQADANLHLYVSLFDIISWILQFHMSIVCFLQPF